MNFKKIIILFWEEHAAKCSWWHRQFCWNKNFNFCKVWDFENTRDTIFLWESNTFWLQIVNILLVLKGSSFTSLKKKIQNLSKIKRFGGVITAILSYYFSRFSEATECKFCLTAAFFDKLTFSLYFFETTR
jgi:hypothetical protein